jgi:hypothetical protein
VLGSRHHPTNRTASGHGVYLDHGHGPRGTADRATGRYRLHEQPGGDAVVHANPRGDTITGRQAVLEFPLPAQLAEPARVVVLAEFSVSTTDPGGWRLSRSFEAVAFWTADGAHASDQACPDQNPDVLAAMRAAGHDPLPERIEPGRTATGWVAFDLPRHATAIDLWCRHLDDDGGFAGAEAALLRIPGS